MCMSISQKLPPRHCTPATAGPARQAPTWRPPRQAYTTEILPGLQAIQSLVRRDQISYPTPLSLSHALLAQPNCAHPWSAPITRQGSSITSAAAALTGELFGSCSTLPDTLGDLWPGNCVLLAPCSNMMGSIAVQSGGPSILYCIYPASFPIVLYPCHCTLVTLGLFLSLYRPLLKSDVPPNKVPFLISLFMGSPPCWALRAQHEAQQSEVISASQHVVMALSSSKCQDSRAPHA